MLGKLRVKVCGLYVAALLNQTHGFDWYMTRLKNTQDVTYYVEIGLHAQKIDTFLASINSKTKRVYVTN